MSEHTKVKPSELSIGDHARFTNKLSNNTFTGEIVGRNDAEHATVKRDDGIGGLGPNGSWIVSDMFHHAQLITRPTPPAPIKPSDLKPGQRIEFTVRSDGAPPYRVKATTLSLHLTDGVVDGMRVRKDIEKDDTPSSVYRWLADVKHDYEIVILDDVEPSMQLPGRGMRDHDDHTSSSSAEQHYAGLTGEDARAAALAAQEIELQKVGRGGLDLMERQVPGHRATILARRRPVVPIDTMDDADLPWWP